jgi:hypothetical protein
LATLDLMLRKRHRIGDAAFLMTKHLTQLTKTPRTDRPFRTAFDALRQTGEEPRGVMFW